MPKVLSKVFGEHETIEAKNQREATKPHAD